MIISLKCIIKSSIHDTKQPNQPNSQMNNNLNQNNDTMLHSKLLQSIHNEFQKQHIKELYPIQIWTERAFWVAMVAVEEKTQEDIHTILQTAHTYLTKQGLPIPPIKWDYWVPGLYSQRDILKPVRQSIVDEQVDSLTAITAAQTSIIGTGVSLEQFNAGLAQLKRTGEVFEPRVGFLKCI